MPHKAPTPALPAHELAITPRDRGIGLACLLGAAVLWSLNGAFIKAIYAGGDGPDGLTISFYRSLFAGLFLLPFGAAGMRALRTPERRTAWPVRPAAILCTVFFAVMTACFVIANTMTAAANAIILQYTSTFWIFGLSPLILGEKPSFRDIRVLVLAMLGIGVIFAGDARTNLAGLLVALSAGLFYALLSLMLRRLRDVSAASITTLVNLGAALLLLPLVMIFGSLMISKRSLVLVLLMGVFQLGLPYYLYALALRRVPAYQAALITLVEPVLVPLWTYLAVGERVSTTTAIGGGMILLALVLYVRASYGRRVTEPGITHRST